MNDVLTSLAPDAETRIPDLCRKFGIKRLQFGSAADGRFDTDSSELDFIAIFADEASSASLFKRYMRFAEALETLFGRRVDLLTKPASDIRNPYLRRAVEAQRTSVFAEE